ncbi:MAG: glycosyltransferase [Solirubrobacteraceae bacterium]|nr:glycosyltransferase [Solirubrobacteraceae bacterium]
MEGERVLIVIPFAGTQEQLATTAEAWRGIGDAGERLVSIVLVDNGRNAQAGSVGPVTVVPAPDHGSSYYARNVGAATAASDWILFVDADCVPDPGIVDEYFAEALDEEIGAVVGGIRPGPGDSLVARYSAARAILDPDHAGSLEEGASAVTANLLVRRAAYEECGGFCEGIRSGGDIDFSWRLQERGWRIAERRSASVRHMHRESVRDLVKQYRRYGAGYGWLQRRYATLDSPRFDGTRPTLGGTRRALLSLGAAATAPLRGQWREASYSVLDAVAAIAWVRGTWDDNRPRWSAAAEMPAPRAAGAIVEVDGIVEVRGRPYEPRAGELRGRALRYWEDDGYGERLRALAIVGSRLLLSCRIRPLTSLVGFGRRQELAAPAHRVETAREAWVVDPDAGAAAVLARVSARLADPRDSAT